MAEVPTDPEVVEVASFEVLRDMLDAEGHQTDEWGKGPTKPLELFWDELQQGESELIRLDGQLTRRTHVVGVNVFATLASGMRYYLRESKQVYANGTERYRGLMASLAEKTTPDEDVEVAVRRAVAEELGIQTLKSLRLGEDVVKNQNSATFNGLPTQLIIRLADVELHEIDYKEEGYVEVQVAKSVHFTWASIAG